MDINLHTTIDYKKLIEMQANNVVVNKTAVKFNNISLDKDLTKKVSKGYQKNLKMMRK